MQLPRRLWYPMVSPIAWHARQSWALDVAVLRCMRMTTDPDRQQRDLIYNFDLVGTIPEASESGQWIDADGLATLSLTWPADGDLITAALADDLGTAVPTLRPAWSRHGWWGQASAWISEQLAALDYPAITALEQVKVWDLSCVLHIVCGDRRAFFKAIPTGQGQGEQPLLFANEPVLMATLGPRFPQTIPIPLAIDGERAWMVLADFGGDLRDHDDMTLWYRTLEVFARLQIDASRQLDNLRNAGCLDRQLPILEGQMDAFVADTTLADVISSAEMARIRGWVPQLKSFCQQLQAHPIPPSLVHGDLNPGNITVLGGQPHFFDWTDGCIAHPFFDLAAYLDEAAEKEGTPGALERLRDHYLTQWIEFAPLPVLQAAFELAEPLGAMHQLVSYQRILANVEPLSRVALIYDLRYHMKKLFAAMASR